MQPGECEHLAAITKAPAPGPVSVRTAVRQECDECVKSGDSWVHLRTCQTCGGTHCCDSSPNRHATRHAQITGHAVISSAEPGERWLYCYPDNKVTYY